MTDRATHDDDTPAFHLFTDGACLGNPGPGGWAYLLRDSRDSRGARGDRGGRGGRGNTIECSGGEASTTNNRMELTGVIEGLLAIVRILESGSGSPSGSSTSVELCSDSQYVLTGIAEWMPKWKAAGWRLAGGKKPVKNVELWRELDALLRRVEVRTSWVRGHDGHPENERCDELASAEAARWARGEGVPSSPRPTIAAPDELFGG